MKKQTSSKRKLVLKKLVIAKFNAASPANQQRATGGVDCFLTPKCTCPYN